MFKQYISIFTTPGRIVNSSHLHSHLHSPSPSQLHVIQKNRSISFVSSSTTTATTATTATAKTSVKRRFSNQSGKGSKTALIIGSSGSLGSTIAQRLKSHHDCVVIGSDIHPPSQARAEAIDAFIQLGSNDNDSTTNASMSIDILHHGIRDGIQNLYNENNSDIQLDAIIVASGGFAMDESHNSGNDENENDNDNENRNGHANVYEEMLHMNYYPVVAAGEIAKQYMTPTNHGLFVMIGAVSALSPAPGMIAYSTSKAAAHYYVQTIGAMTGNALRREHKISRTSEMGHELRRKYPCFDSMTALGILPIMLDTESNRDALPKDDFSQWTKPMDIAKEIGTWVDNPVFRPHSGSLMKVLTTDGVTQFVLAR